MNYKNCKKELYMINNDKDLNHEYKVAKLKEKGQELGGDVLTLVPALNVISIILKWKDILTPENSELLEFDLERKWGEIPEELRRITNSIRLKTIMGNLLLSVSSQELYLFYLEVFKKEFTDEQDENTMILSFLECLTPFDVKFLLKEFAFLDYSSEYVGVRALKSDVNSKEMEYLLMDYSEYEECQKVSRIWAKLEHLNLLLAHRVTDISNSENLDMKNKIVTGKKFKVNDGSYYMYFLTLSQWGHIFRKFLLEAERGQSLQK